MASGSQPNVLWIVGASGRAAAQSARRAGFEPLVADAFADWDTRQVARTFPVRPYPHGLLRLVRQAAPQDFPPLMYVGGLENHPHLLTALARHFAIVGTAPERLPQLRNPWCVAQVVRSVGMHALELIPDHRPPSHGVYVWKRFRSAGGAHVHLHAPQSHRYFAPSKPGNGYYQQFAYGRVYGVVYVANGQEARLLGVSRQLTGVRAWGGKRFGYCGSLTTERCPIDPDLLQRLGRALTEAFGLVGLFGVDLIVRGKTACLVEVNPRYTASCEIIEEQLGHSLIAYHWSAWRHGQLPETLPMDTMGPRYQYGKAVLYAGRTIRISTALHERLRRVACRPSVKIADIPCGGGCIRSGSPLVTLLARGKDRIQVRRRLNRLAFAVRSIVASSKG